MESGQQIGTSEIRDRLAQGGMAEVYVAVLRGAAGFEKRVALKRILPGLENIGEFKEMFAREARLLARLSHANVVQVHDFDEVAGIGFYIAMELIDGRDLAAVWREALEHGLHLPASLSARIVLEVGAALAHAHELVDAEGRGVGLVHRDISPQNVLLSRDGAVKLTDFGIAKAFDAASAEGTRSGVLKGKFAYMSPEQTRGAPLDGRSDLFSLGVVLWELLCGERLFREAEDLATLEAVRSKPVPPPSSRNPVVPAALDAVVMRSLQRDPGARFQRAAEMVEALEPLTGEHAGVRGREAIGMLARGEIVEPPAPEGPFKDEPVRLAPASAETRLSEPVGAGDPAARSRSAGRSPLTWLLLAGVGVAVVLGAAALLLPDDPELPAPQAEMTAAISDGLLNSRAPTPVPSPGPSPKPPAVTTAGQEAAGQGAPVPVEPGSFAAAGVGGQRDAAGGPGAAPSDTIGPAAARPGAARMGTAKPGSASSGTAKPGAARSDRRARPAVSRSDASKPAAIGVLSISVVPWGAVWVDGEELRDAPIQGLELGVGRHQVRAEHPRLGRREKTIDVRPGDNGTLILRFDTE